MPAILPRFRLRAVSGVAALGLLAGGLHVSAVDKTDNPHEPGGAPPAELCASCHLEAPGDAVPDSTRTVLPKSGAFASDPVKMCLSCHEDAEESHPVGTKPEYPVPADLPLDENGSISCLTCHYTHGSLHSDHQCASSSLLDRFFNRERLYKSYLLRRDNPRGELCKACHQTTSEPKEAKP